MPANRELRATPLSGRATWIAVIGMALALAGSSFAMLPAASAQDRSQRIHVANGVIVCERGVDRRAYMENDRRSGNRGNCVLADEFVDDFVYSPTGDLAYSRDGVARTGLFDPGRLAITEVVSQQWSAPRVFCSWSSRSGTVLVQDVEHVPISVRSPGSSTVTYTISLQNDEANQSVECWWIHLADDLPGAWTPPPFDTLTAGAYACPEGVMPPQVNADLSDYDQLEDYYPLVEACTTPLGVTFDLVDANGTRARNAGRDGQVIFADVEMGVGRVVQLAERVPEGRGDPIVFCTDRYVGDGYAPQPDVFGSVMLTPENERLGTADCNFFHFTGPVRLEPGLQITPPTDIIVTPVAPIQLPTSTAELPQLEVTPPVQDPEIIITPVIPVLLPTPSPTPVPEIGEPPVIEITPVIQYPIEIVTPIVPFIPIVPTEPPDLIHRDPGRAPIR